MSGRPQLDPTPSGRRSRRYGGRVLSGAAALTVAAVGVAGVGLARDGDAAPQCEPVALHVVVTPEAGAAVRDAVGRTSSECLRLSVTERESADVAAALTAGGSERPDVWIPDSSVWAPRLVAGPLAGDIRAVSLASSPVVLAVPAAASAGPQHRVDVGRLLSTDPRERVARLALPDPRQSAAVISAFLGLEASAAELDDGRAALAGALRDAARGVPPAAVRDLSELSADPPTAVPVPEQVVWQHNQERETARRVAAAYLPDPAFALDYPYLVLDDDLADPAERLLTALTNDQGHEAFLAHGFRRPDGTPGQELTSAAGVDGGTHPGAATPSPDSVASAVRAFDVVTLGSRLLAVIDVSGSMAQPVPGTGGLSRLELAKQAAARGLALYPDDTAIGLWVFSTSRPPTPDHRELVPIGRLHGQVGDRPRRVALLEALSAVQPLPRGDTGLYDTALASVRAVREGWEPGKVNSVVLLTDGRNDDEVGITLDQLVRTLRAEDDPERPVALFTIGYGEGADAAALEAMSRATGGASYIAEDPRQIGSVLLDAIGQRTCRPRC